MLPTYENQIKHVFMLNFSLLMEGSNKKDEMAHLDSDASNELFDTLERWEAVLKHRKSLDFQVPPCP